MRFLGPGILQLLLRRRGDAHGAFLPFDFRDPPHRQPRTRAAAARGRATPDRDPARAAGAAARQPGARGRSSTRSPRAARRWSRPGSRWACSSARSTASTRRRRRWRWRAPSKPRAGCAACRCSGCRRRITTSPRSRRCRSRPATAGRCGSRSPATPVGAARVDGRGGAWGRRSRRSSSAGGGAAARPPPATETWTSCAGTTSPGAPIAAARSPARWRSCSPTRACCSSTRATRASRRWPRRFTGAPSAAADARRGACRRAAPRSARPGFDEQIPCRPDCALLLLPPRRRRTGLGSACSASRRAGRPGASRDCRGATPSSARRARRRARARAAAVLDVGAAAADPPGQPVADRGLRRRPGRGELLRPARRRSTTRSS